jgi:lipopolysaccharide biosynthesis glycosyltransferase
MATKKPLAFLLAISENLAFAAGNVALSIYKYMRDEAYEVVIYHSGLKPSDRAAFLQIPTVRLIEFQFPDFFLSRMLEALPVESRFRDSNHLMCFCHFEVFSLLSEYEIVVWLDADVSVQRNLKRIIDFRPFGITLDAPWDVQGNFTQPISGYRTDLPGHCTAVMVVDDSLPSERMHGWCYSKAIEYAHLFINPDQAIINLLFQEFELQPKLMPLEQWQCISWKDEAIIANIVHFGTARKVWNETNICSAFPEWYRVHLEWLAIGGSDFDQSRIHPRNALPALNELDRIREASVTSEDALPLPSRPVWWRALLGRK